MKVGIVVPYSWSFWGGVIEHAEQQAHALRELGIETRTSWATTRRALHAPPPPAARPPREPPPDVIPVGRSVIVPANGSLPNIVLSPRAVSRIRGSSSASASTCSTCTSR